MSEVCHCPVYDMADVISMKIDKNALKSEFIH